MAGLRPTMQGVQSSAARCKPVAARALQPLAQAPTAHVLSAVPAPYLIAAAGPIHPSKDRWLWDITSSIHSIDCRPIDSLIA
jgi:hypothetical protein